MVVAIAVNTASASTLYMCIGTFSTDTPETATAGGITVSNFKTLRLQGSAVQALGGQITVDTRSCWCCCLRKLQLQVAMLAIEEPAGVSTLVQQDIKDSR